MRLIHAVRELAAESGERIETVALYTDVDKSAPFVREADLAYNLGLAADRPYLNLEVLEQALVETKADAAWVGWGFVAEIPEFAELCEKVGVTFVGPSAEAMRKLGDKIGSKLIAEEVGVPVAPWSRGAVENLEHALRVAEEVTYPLMLKATAGGGGRGIRKITTPAELEENFERTSLEAARAFGSGVMFLERLVTGARHVEVQVIADGQGTAWALGVRDCSVQRRNQKIIEESASCVLEQHQVDELKASAERLANAVGYRGACTVEFLYHPGEKLFAFLEVNTRLQVEHPITEITTGFDLVKAQLHVAGGGKLEGDKPVELGHAVEARLNAEDPDRDFAPCPGTIVRLELPAGPGIRVDTDLRDQHHEAERLDEVPVGPEVQPVRLVDLAVLGRHHQYRRPHAVRPHALQHPVPRQPGQHDVEQHHVERTGQRHPQRGGPVRGGHDLHALRRETALQRPTHADFVVHDQHPRLHTAQHAAHGSQPRA